MSEMENTLKTIQLEEENRELTTRLSGMRQIISLCICAVCSEDIGTEEIGQNESENICHLRCVEKNPNRDDGEMTVRLNGSSPLEQRLYRTPYLVIPRLALEAMPLAWQRALERLLAQADATGLETPEYAVLRIGDPSEHHVGAYEVHDPGGDEEPKWEYRAPPWSDPWADYRRGKVEDLCPGFRRPQR